MGRTFVAFSMECVFHCCFQFNPFRKYKRNKMESAHDRAKEKANGRTREKVKSKQDVLVCSKCNNFRTYSLCAALGCKCGNANMSLFNLPLHL